jgi:hypothetical protein
MEILENPELELTIKGWINQRSRELSGPRSSGIHMTELMYCLTRSYYERLAPTQKTFEDVLTMSLGIFLERVIVPAQWRAEGKCKDGIDYSPDFWSDAISGRLNELKTTRMSSKKADTNDWPESWIEQMKGYCYAEGLTEYGLCVVHIMGNYKPPMPELRTKRFIFTELELKQNWEYLLFRKEQLINCFATQVPPTPKKWCKGWECKFCQYKARCG